MKISLNWIKDYVELDENLDPLQVLERVTMSTAEVEEIETVGSHFKDVVVAKVLATKPHPDADKLKLVTVFDGKDEMEVVCGAPNVAEGQIVALAKVGTTLPGGTLKPTKIRGVMSEGMICADDELGLSDDHSGIIIFDDNLEVGTTLDKIYGEEDIVLEVDNKSLTHRPDLWGHIGFAREFAAIYHKPLKLDIKTEAEKPAECDILTIENKISDLCPRYSALVVKNVKVCDSPDWLKRRLETVGVRSINNLVDVTNYVMMEYGQPMHAFDRRYIEGDKIVIRCAENKEKFTTLDEAEHQLITDDIMIADAVKAVALGGVMGGLNSEIVEDTTTVVLESANFHPATIRCTANRLGLRTDAAQRFEKSQDPANTVPAMLRAVKLIKLTCPDAEIASDILDSWPNPPEKVTIEISIDYINTRLGNDLSQEMIVGILTSLDFDVKEDGRNLTVGVPSYRATKDVGIKADIVEEIGRIYGYDNINPYSPTILSDPPDANELRLLEWYSRDVFCKRLGFDEVSNYSFISAQMLESCGYDAEVALRVKNPVNKDDNLMRTTLMPHICANVATNQKNMESFRLFELGRTTISKNRKGPDLAAENRRLSGAVYGEGDNSFYQVKGAVEEFLTLAGLPNIQFKLMNKPPAWAHGGRCAEVFSIKKSLGVVAELHPAVAEKFEIKQRTGVFDLDFDAVFNTRPMNMKFKPLRKYPVNSIEITVVVDKRVRIEEIEEVIRKSSGKMLVTSEFLYLYEGENVAADKKAVTYHVDFGANDRTLSGEEVAGLHEKLLDSLDKAGMPIRGKE